MTLNRSGFTDLDAVVAAEVRSEIARTKTVTVSSLAADLGIRRATLSARINGRAPFAPSLLSSVAQRLGTTNAPLPSDFELQYTDVIEAERATGSNVRGLAGGWDARTARVRLRGDVQRGGDAARASGGAVGAAGPPRPGARWRRALAPPRLPPSRSRGTATP